MAFSPVEASKHISEKYSRYLNTIFSIDNEVYNKQLKQQLSSMDSFAAGPYLDVSDSFEKGASINELIKENVLAPGFNRINMPIDRPLYKHQENAIRRVLSEHNLIVSTGTGSGKTESFLIPVLNHIIREHESGTLNSGVRALLVYPMNALANDQVERLRDLLSDYEEITYGIYTGQTKNSYKDAIIEYLQLNDNRRPAKNELISRDQIKENPPHILITNYAMLEYLMVRPGDSIFFNEENSNKWKYIVLDEAHVYGGSSGIEVSMLLRRLKARLQNDNIRYILTSATLGDEKSNREVAMFGKNLCSSDFSVRDIERAIRIIPRPENDIIRLSKDFYTSTASLIEDDYSEESINDSLKNMDYYDKKCSLEENLYNIILHDINYSDIKKLVSETNTIKMIAKKMEWSVEEITSFVTVASKAEKNGIRLFDARYHSFLRATESIFITLNPSNKLFLTRKKKHFEDDGTEYKVFEAATCSVCHSLYLIGTIKNDILEQSSFTNEEDLKSVFLLKNEISDTDDDHSMEDEMLEAEAYELCPHCGFIRRVGLARNKCCEHEEKKYIKVFKVQSKNESGKITKCLACENTNAAGIIRMFFTGQEAVTSVIGTALFEELPSYECIREKNDQEDDEFGFGTISSNSYSKSLLDAKQFIAFSDSRQAAAFYTTYLDQTYHNILYKRLINETLNSYKNGWKGKKVPEFVDDLAAKFEEFNIINDMSNKSIKEAWKAILQEMVDNNGVTSMFNMGLIGFTFNPDLFIANDKLKLTGEELCTLCNVLALGMMADAAIDYDCSMTKSDKAFFSHNGVQYSYTLSDPDSKGYRRSFIPRFSDRMNKRSDYCRRVMNKAGLDYDNEKANRLIEKIWSAFFVSKDFVKANNGAYRINSNEILITKPSKWYVCSKCKHITPYNVHGVCTSYRCDGELNEINLEEVYKNNHYYRIYQDLEIRDLRIVEHTAQLDRNKAYEYQKEFKKKEIDILSCSTTFEMGVDVGSLETVFMRNMPPSPANYAQRAGRAGRSKNAAAFALTFCNKSNHDFAFFANPVRMIKGRIDPPNFIIDNEKIAIRHIYASALSYFWAKYPQYFDNATTLIDDRENGNGIERFKEYLYSKPEDLKAYILRFLPYSLVEKYDVNTYGWLDRLLGQEEDSLGVLTKAVNDYKYEVGVLEKAKDEAYKKGGSVDRYTNRIKVYKNEDILTFLSRKNVMPKYGFPVDTVEMTVNGKGDNSNLGLQLQRDLALALSEYAPGSQIVANGNLITSRYIKKIPSMSWKMYDYITCDCRTLNIEPHVGDKFNSKLNVCHQCKRTLDQSKKRVFLVPEFGFEADGDKIEKPGLTKPEKTYKGDVSYVGFREEIDTQCIDINGSIIEFTASKGDEMAVINESNFYVCEQCGYTDLDEKTFSRMKQMAHKRSSGYPCLNNRLYRYSLGYRFETDVFQLRFIYPDIEELDDAISIIYGLLRGICAELNIDQGEVAGCAQCYMNDYTGKPNFAMILYDKTPGGAGHVRRLANKEVIERVLYRTLELMEACTCGGDDKDSSCYQCLRSYYNQKYHDKLSRKVVIDFINKVLDKSKKQIVYRNNKSENKRHNNKKIQFSFSNVGSNQKSLSATEIWDNILDDCETEKEIELITSIKELDNENIDKPIYGEAAEVIETNERFSIDLMWKDKQVMLFLDESYEDYLIACKSDWKCFCTREGFDIHEFINVIGG